MLPHVESYKGLQKKSSVLPVHSYKCFECAQFTWQQLCLLQVNVSEYRHRCLSWFVLELLSRAPRCRFPLVATVEQAAKVESDLRLHLDDTGRYNVTRCCSTCFDNGRRCRWQYTAAAAAAGPMSWRWGRILGPARLSPAEDEQGVSSHSRGCGPTITNWRKEQAAAAESSCDIPMPAARSPNTHTIPPPERHRPQPSNLQSSNVK